jgi:hypothetical protein
MESKVQGEYSVVHERVVVVLTHVEMEPYIAAWDDLAAHASEPNPFYESWALLPAWKHLAGPLDIRIILVFSSDNSQPTDRPLLLGLFPILAHLKHKTLRIAIAVHWLHTHSMLGTPLLRKGYERAALVGLFEWLDANRNLGRILSFEHVGGDGPFFENLQALVNDQKRVMFSHNEFSRGVFRPMVDAETYFRTVLSVHRRKILRKHYSHLGKSGKLETLELGPGDDLDHWLQSFFALEGSGWKGKLGTAIVCSPIDVRFFTELSKNAFEKRRLQMLMLRLDDRPIAMQYSLVSTQGAFVLKIAYDEDFKQYSPGTILSVESFRICHGHPDVPWWDSCRAGPVDKSRENVWNESRLIRSLFVSTSDRIGKTILRVLPVARNMRRALRSLNK